MLVEEKRPGLTVIDPPRLRICLLGYRSNPYSGGQGIYIRFLSKALADAGHSVDVISGEPYPELDDRVRLIKLPGLNLYEADNHVTALRPRHLLSYTDFAEWFIMLTGGFGEPYAFGRRLVDYFQRHCPDYDIIHDNQSLCYGTLALQEMGYPLVTTIHHPITSDLRIALASARNWYSRLLVHRWHSFLRMQKKVVSRLASIVTVSEASRRDIASDFGVTPGSLRVIYNGIDTDVFRRHTDLEPRPFNIMTTASADVPLKGLDYLLRAIANLRTYYPDIHLTLLGRLKRNGDTARLIDQLGLRDRISFHSGLTSQEVARLYGTAVCAVVPSIYEGFGLPAGEAMACEVPVIATDGGALPEVVGDAGLTVPVRDTDALEAAIRQLLDDPALRQSLARKGRERILEKFSWQVTAREMERFYRQVSSRRMQA